MKEYFKKLFLTASRDYFCNLKWPVAQMTCLVHNSTYWIFSWAQKMWYRILVLNLFIKKMGLPSEQNSHKILV